MTWQQVIDDAVTGIVVIAIFWLAFRDSDK